MSNKSQKSETLSQMLKIMRKQLIKLKLLRTTLSKKSSKSISPKLRLRMKRNKLRLISTKLKNKRLMLLLKKSKSTLKLLKTRTNLRRLRMLLRRPLIKRSLRLLKREELKFSKRNKSANREEKQCGRNTVRPRIMPTMPENFLTKSSGPRLPLRELERMLRRLLSKEPRDWSKR